MRLAGIPEEVELVTEFAQLRSGMVCWMSPCPWCASKHRLILLGYRLIVPGHYADGRYDEKGGFETAPTQCRPKPIIITGIESRCLYRVVDPALGSTQITATRKREPVRP